MALLFPQAHAQIAWSRGHEALDKELQQVVREAELGRRLVDKLFRVWRTSGDEEWVLIHVEVQAEQESEFERRMFVYHYRLFDRYNRGVVSLAVLADDQATWRPQRFGYELWNCGIAFWFATVKLLDWSADEQALETSANPIAAVVLAHLKLRRPRMTRMRGAIGSCDSPRGYIIGAGAPPTCASFVGCSTGCWRCRPRLRSSFVRTWARMRRRDACPT